MSRRKTHRTLSWKRNLSWEVLERIATILTAEHLSLLEGLSLHKSSAVWAKANGLFTVRLVYRAEKRASLVFSFTNINLGSAEREALH